MKCHILFAEKNKKNISKCRLLKILPRVLSVKKPHLLLSFSQSDCLIKVIESNFHILDDKLCRCRSVGFFN